MTEQNHPKTRRRQLALRRLRMAEAVAAGSSVAAVASAMGVSTETVRRACREHGAEAAEHRLTQEQIARIAYDLGRKRKPKHDPRTVKRVLSLIAQVEGGQQ